MLAKTRILQLRTVKLRRRHKHQLGNTQVVEVDTRIIKLFELHFGGKNVHVFVVARYVNNVFGLQHTVGHGHTLLHVTYETTTTRSLSPNLHHT